MILVLIFYHLLMETLKYSKRNDFKNQRIAFEHTSIEPLIYKDQAVSCNNSAIRTDYVI